MRHEKSEKVWSFLNILGLARYENILISEVVHESDNFILIEYKGQSVWLPKSKISMKKIKEGIQLQVPAWLQKTMDSMTKN